MRSAATGGQRPIRRELTLRDADTDGFPPHRSRVGSPYDIDVRWGGERDLVWYGCKLHISGSCDATTLGWQRENALRVGVEATIAQATKVTDAGPPR